MYEMEKPHLQLLLPRYDFLGRKSEIRSGCIRWKSLTCSYYSHNTMFPRKSPTCSDCSHDTILLSKKTKSGQDVQDEKAPPAAASSTLQFLQVKKRNQVKMWVGKEIPTATSPTIWKSQIRWRYMTYPMVHEIC